MDRSFQPHHRSLLFIGGNKHYPGGSTLSPMCKRLVHFLCSFELCYILAVPWAGMQQPMIGLRDGTAAMYRSHCQGETLDRPKLQLHHRPIGPIGGTM